MSGHKLWPKHRPAEGYSNGRHVDSAGLKGCRGEVQCKETNNTHPHTHSKVHTAVTKLYNICPLLTTLFMSSRWAIQNLHRRRAELSCLYPPSTWLAKLSAEIVPWPPRNFTSWLWTVKFTPYKKIRLQDYALKVEMDEHACAQVEMDEHACPQSPFSNFMSSTNGSRTVSMPDSSQPRQEQHTLTEWPSAVSETVGWYCPRGSRTCLNMLCRYTLIILGRSIRSFWVLFSVTCPVSNSTTPTYTSCAVFHEPSGLQISMSSL